MSIKQPNILLQRVLTCWIEGQVGPAVIEIAPFCTECDLLQDPHVAGRRAKILQACAELDKSYYKCQSYLAADAFVCTIPVVDVRVGRSVEFELMGM
jgi:hypothetical protein